jgi:mono/diheme cytochrome c family protein
VTQKGWRFLLAAVLVAGCQLRAQNTPVTAVSGESWLNHLNRSFGDTSMGKTGHLGPGPLEEASLKPHPQPPIYSSRDGMELHGADLYRLNCQGCHGESGLGAPPEINSMVNPVRATSAPLVVARMKSSGMDVSYADAATMAEQAKTALLDRLHKGGESMPAFSHLSEAEIRALLAHVKHLAGVPGAGDEKTVIKESHVRVGELIVKSTCHTCHSATGADPSSQELAAGAIPPLSTLTGRKNQSEFIRKVTQGAPVLMGAPPILYRGRMPVFFYLSQEEAADVYLYLTLYPPIDSGGASPLVVASHSSKPDSGQGTGPHQQIPVVDDMKGRPLESSDNAEFEWLVVLLIAALVSCVLVGGLVYTLHEFKRLSPEEVRQAHRVRHLRAEMAPSGRMKMIEQTTGAMLYSGAKRSSQ